MLFGVLERQSKAPSTGCWMVGEVPCSVLAGYLCVVCSFRLQARRDVACCWLVALATRPIHQHVDLEAVLTVQWFELSKLSKSHRPRPLESDTLKSNEHAPIPTTALGRSQFSLDR